MFALGNAGGLLLAGILLGFFRARNPMFGYIPQGAINMLKDLGTSLRQLKGLPEPPGHAAAGLEQLRLPTPDFAAPSQRDIRRAVDFIGRHVEAAAEPVGRLVKVQPVGALRVDADRVHRVLVVQLAVRRQRRGHDADRDVHLEKQRLERVSVTRTP